MLVRVLIFTLAFSVSALRLSSDKKFNVKSSLRDVQKDDGYVDVSNCPQHVNKSMWALWIDGRDASKGQDAYGKHYHGPFMKSLEHSYRLAGTGGDADLKLYEAIFVHLRSQWRNYNNPAHGETKSCHQKLPKEKVLEIMSTVTVVNDHYCPARALTVEAYRDSLQLLFESYSREVEGHPGRAKELFALSKLMQNLAYIHPMMDHNGRSRLTLLQYILRQRHLACGTMMYNNNKNIYFESATDFVKLLEEGIEKYSESFAKGFSENPWQSELTLAKHFKMFPKPEYVEEVEKCWHAHTSSINGGAQDTSPTSFAREEVGGC